MRNQQQTKWNNYDCAGKFATLQLSRIQSLAAIQPTFDAKGCDGGSGEASGDYPNEHSHRIEMLSPVTSGQMFFCWFGIRFPGGAHLNSRIEFRNSGVRPYEFQPAQFSSPDFSGVRLGQLRDEIYFSRIFIRSDFLFYKLLQLPFQILRRNMGLVEDHESFRNETMQLLG